MSDWISSRLGAEVDLVTGFPFASSEYSDRGIRLLRGDNIVQGKLRWSGVKYWPTDKRAGLERYLLEEDDVVLAMDRPWIDAGLKYATIDTADLPALLVQRVARLRGGAALDTRFLRYLIGSPSFTEHVLAVQTGTAVPHISGKQILEYRFDRPPLREQRAIVGVLGAIDDKIELNRRMNATLEELAQIRFEEMPRMVSVSLGEIVALARETVDPSSEPESVFEHFSIPAYDDGRVPVLERGASIKSGKLVVNEGSVLLSKLNPRIPRVWLPDISCCDRPICSTEFLVVMPNSRSSREFLYLLFCSPRFVDEFAGRVAGTSGSHQRVKAQDALSIEVQLPDNAELAELTALLRPLFDRVDANRRESRTLAELRDALLPKLISGELRVRQAEAIEKL